MSAASSCPAAWLPSGTWRAPTRPWRLMLAAHITWTCRRAACPELPPCAAQRASLCSHLASPADSRPPDPLAALWRRELRQHARSRRGTPLPVLTRLRRPLPARGPRDVGATVGALAIIWCSAGPRLPLLFQTWFLFCFVSPFACMPARTLPPQADATVASPLSGRSGCRLRGSTRNTT